jgi:hypothetical protein
MNHPVDRRGFENPLDQLFVADIPFDELVAFAKISLHIREVGKIPGIGEKVQIDHPHMICFVEDMPHKIAANETATACDKYFHAGFAFPKLIIIILQLECQ